MSIIDQIIFYFKKPKSISVYIAYVDNIKAGYLLLNSSEANTYITEVVSEKFRGIGVGSAMISFSKNNYSDLVAIIKHTNVKSINLHIKNGFSPTKIDGDLIHFKFKE